MTKCCTSFTYIMNESASFKGQVLMTWQSLLACLRRLCLGCGLRVVEPFSPVVTGERTKFHRGPINRGTIFNQECGPETGATPAHQILHHLPKLPSMGPGMMDPSVLEAAAAIPTAQMKSTTHTLASLLCKLRPLLHFRWKHSLQTRNG